MKKLNYKILILLVIILLVGQGCKNKLVTLHNIVGESLIAVKHQSIILHEHNGISDGTYQSIRINWLRAQKSYLEASFLLDKILDSEMPDTVDISNYYELLTQVSIIADDIALWLEEKN